MSKQSIWSLWGGFALIILGAIFLFDQFFPINVMGFLWPLFVIVPGLLFLTVMFTGGRDSAPFAIPGCTITAVGLLLFFQNAFNLWATWAYAWALIVVAAGVGLYLFGSRQPNQVLRQVGTLVMVVGAILFFTFGMLFELSAMLFRARSLGGVFWGLLLIMAGAAFLLRNQFMSRFVGPINQQVVNFASTSTSTSTASTSNFAAPAAQVVDVNEVSAVDAPVQQPYVSAENNNPLSAGVNQLDLRTMGEMVILIGEQEGLRIEAPEEIRQRIRTRINDTPHGKRLEIWYEWEWLDWLGFRFWNGAPIRYELTLRDLIQLDTSGVGKITVPQLNTTSLSIRQSGAGDIFFHNLTANQLDILLSGVGSINMVGRVNQQSITLSGAGSYHADKLESQSAEVHLSGVGSAAIRVVEHLRTRITSVGSIEYYGSPRVDQQNSGLGSVKQLGN